MKNMLAVFTLLFLTSLACASEPKVLMVISSYGTLEKPDLSYDLEELAQSFLVLHDNGIKLDIASPRGGAVLVKNNKDDLAYIQRFKSLALEKLKNTLPTKSVDADDYDGVFIVGGGGAMMDLPFDKGTQILLTRFVRQEKPLAAVCHGPAAIADIKLVDGSFFVSNRQVNSFTNEEELAFSKEHAALFPFLLEDKLKENGALFVNNSPMLPFIAVDKNLITAQNPSSVAQAAEAMVLMVSDTVMDRDLFRDEATMQLLSRARSEGPGLIDVALAKSADSYDISLLALYGFYAYSLAEEENKLQELNLMEVISGHFQHIKFDTVMIERLVEQGQVERAEAQLRLFKLRYPESERVKQLASLIEAS